MSPLALLHVASALRERSLGAIRERAHRIVVEGALYSTVWVWPVASAIARRMVASSSTPS
ncbi:hypothetical protein J2S67_000028 [Pseudoglutamicibacter albus]|uniref:Uncharacterized protein n=1 Tax=Pseudoglutamicibacter albus TaxID=98671 RepID=A0ABU1YWL8_9MICC|nr:hypothetical protein [Pseudoglutamicibacter albus]